MAITEPIPFVLNMTLHQAIEMQAACLVAVQYYDGVLKNFPEGDTMRAYWLKRKASCQESADLIRALFSLREQPSATVRRILDQNA